MRNDVADYQMSAWLMAVWLNGLTLDETLALTDALLASGKRIDFSTFGKKVVDKHSTGGVGDKVTLVLGPLVASCGAVFGKMSGRGLGHTGGTIDKLESIPGFRTEMVADAFVNQLREIGICVIGQSEDLAPADKRLYALRDVTATVESNPLIAASIISKKLAGGAAAVVIDIKVGSGSFFKTKGHASGVAHLMNKVGESRGIIVDTIMTSMQQPLGYAVGNSLEVLEAVKTLKGTGPADLVDVVVALAVRLLGFSDLGWSRGKAEAEVRQLLATGAALPKFREWIICQGGDDAFIDDPSALAVAGTQFSVPAPKSGWVTAIDALSVGNIAQQLGCGRLTKEDRIDHSVGILLEAKIGDWVEKDQQLAQIFATVREQGDSAVKALVGAYTISKARKEPPKVLLD